MLKPRMTTKMFVLRRGLDLTQEELARRVGVSQPRISNIESGEDDTPPKSLMEKIAEVLGYVEDPMTLQDSVVAPKEARVQLI